MLIQLISEWLDKQRPFASGGGFKTNSPESISRKQTMQLLASEFESVIDEQGLQVNGEPVQVDMSRGMGVDTSIPYVRFFDSRTPRPTKGWSLVLFANENAESVSLAIGLGVYKGAKTRATLKYTDQLLEDPNVPLDLRQRLQIGSPGLAGRYEAGSPVSKTWTREDLAKTSDEDFAAELKRNLKVFEYVLSKYPPLEEESPSSKFSGKWLIQFKPSFWDFDGVVADGHQEVTFRIGNYKEVIQKGDIVYFWRSGSRAGIVASGRVAAGPEDRTVDEITSSYYRTEVDKDAIETRVAIRIDEVYEEYLSKADLEDVLSTNLIYRAPQHSSPFPLTLPEFEGIAERLGKDNSKNKEDSIDSLAEKLFIDAHWLETVKSELLGNGQIILQGPPGTGKTFLARALAGHVSDGVALVQFHPSYSYEDFVEGFRPVKSGDSFTYELKPGPLVSIADEAIARPDKKFVLIIDEINRGNLAKIFGELYFLLEYRDSEVTMQYRTYGETFSLPPNLYFIGTMNTADRSISSLDMAIRRRFSFVELNPSKSPTQGLLNRWLLANNLNPKISDFLDFINSQISDDRVKLGPSYFMKKNIESEIEKIWEFQVFPQLKEIFFDNRAVLEGLTFQRVSEAIKFESK